MTLDQQIRAVTAENRQLRQELSSTKAELAETQLVLMAAQADIYEQNQEAVLALYSGLADIVEMIMEG